jgi:hypothetical protein
MKDLIVLQKKNFLIFGNFNPDPEIFNLKLKDWLIEFNFKRPYTAFSLQNTY